MVLALLSNFSPYLHFLKNIIYVTTKCLSSVVPSFTKICQRNFEILWNFYMKGMISTLIEYSFAAHILDCVPCTYFKPLEAGRRVRFRKTGK